MVFENGAYLPCRRGGIGSEERKKLPLLARRYRKIQLTGCQGRNIPAIADEILSKWMRN